MGGLTAIVLGAAAGGGFPQWNCRCRGCTLAWAGDPRVKPRSQASVAVSADGEHWLLLNASPDLRAQLLATAALHPRGSPRGSPIAGIILTGAEVDQTAGLLHLRERAPLALFATPLTLSLLQANPMFRALDRDMVKRQCCALGETFCPLDGVMAELFVVPGKIPLYLEDGDPDLDEGTVPVETESNVGVELVSGGKRLVYVPSVAALSQPLTERLARADVVLCDGTLYDDNEMIASGTGTKTSRRMGHVPIDGGSLAMLEQLPGRRIYIHINNTNPILIEDSPQRRRVAIAGIEVAEDGMEIVL
jgi:pyrroloquinoline quinone biosynthesis protein B